MRELMTGNEAIARGVYESGITFAAAYPGTPSTEILETLATRYRDDLHAEWAPNEKVAVESAIGYSFVGGRAFSSMKQVGLNVAADPLFSFAYEGANGGFVFVTADEPGIHSSQTEQDNRFYAGMMDIIMLEPSDSQECKDMVIEGIRLSEKFNIPVMVRMTTRVCHSKSFVEMGERTEVPKREYVRDVWQRTTMPAVSIKLRHEILEKLPKMAAASEESDFNYSIINEGAKIGVVTSGISFQYAKDALGDAASYFKVGFPFPLPTEKIREFASKFDKLYVIEESEPFLEFQLKDKHIDCIGRELFPQEGELSTAIIKEKVLGIRNETIDLPVEKIKARPPVFCAGCPHRGLFYELGKRAKSGKIFISGDIGCYGISPLPPFNATDTIVCMGESVSGGHGAAKAFEYYGTDMKSVSVLGDSTFFHSGMTGLLDIVYNHSNSLVIIMDNRTTGMTGHQDNPGTGYTARGTEAPAADITAIVKAFGIKNVRTINPLVLAEVSKALDWGLGLSEPAVIITRWPCALKKFSPDDLAEFDTSRHLFEVQADKCIGCKKCTQTACPALRYDNESKKAGIYAPSCNGCGICAQVCPADAISMVK
ncbi:thiamine pyrophosphate-dependent enzyme [Aminicella lysinilytica]|uniref:Indolepyruvate oxidoreductase subunit IorA n=1 Tax=Aminicella lysinilytica TaxID=433323 RepID=A0A4R6Q966_9FIRM|nr:thiamine pyrophosphate-dependent enzyme [Aminicella lysinilytica]NLD11764.1 4Fe-4S binding protein [Clostridiales bacterium]TDP59128.1 indolepyruvate ferredoxin oxidoreductase alpha subunit [Aminicella lysinilytica]